MHFNCGVAPVADEHVHIRYSFGTALVLFSEIVRNFSIDSFSIQMESSVTWKVGQRISMCNVCPDGKPALLPPLIGQRERAAAQRKGRITEAVVLEHLAASQTGVNGLAMHSIHEHFAVVSFQARYVSGL